MRWRRAAALVVMAASAIGAVAAIAATPAAGAPEDATPCVLDPETGQCMPDRDRDGKSDTIDNCPDAYNPGQEDNDRDGLGNACDQTPDGDGGGGGGGGGSGGGSSACAAGDGVFFYQHVDYQGACFKLTKDVNHGFYFSGVGNNQLSSVRIVGPYSVTLYVDEWYGGGSVTLTASSPNASTWTGGPANDNVSSAKLLLDADHDAWPDHADNCPSYHSPDNRCDADSTGSVEEDELGAPSAATGASTASSAGCGWRRIGRKHHNIFGKALIRYTLRVDWCWNATVITSVNVRVSPEIIAGCCWRFTRHVAYDVYDTAQDVTYYANWGRTYFKVLVQGEFELCLPYIDCPKAVYPWIALTANRGGSSTKSSGGTR